MSAGDANSDMGGDEVMSVPDGSVNHAWGLDQPPQQSKTKADFVTYMIGAVSGALKNYGSVGAFLRQRFQDPGSKQEFLNAINSLVNMEQTNFALNSDLPVSKPDLIGAEAPLRLHLACFSFSVLASQKGEPEDGVVKMLAEQILHDGFVSSGDPLFVSCPAELLAEVSQDKLKAPWMTNVGNPLHPFSIGYVKGQARILTLLTILTIGLDDKVDFNEAWL